MKKQQKPGGLRAATAVGIAIATAITLTACGGGGDDNSPVAGGGGDANTVPDSVGASAASFIAFIQGLALGDETSEPLTFNASFTPPPEDNTSEPAAL